MDRTLALVMLMAVMISQGSLPVNAARKNCGLGKQKVTHLEFYMHDVVMGENATAVQVAPQKPMNFSGGVPFFGPVYVIDDPLTESPHPKSKLLGRAQGLYAMSSQGEFSLLMALTYSMERGKYKDSSISVVGKNMVLRKQRELPIVGGTGLFRMARGYAFAQTHSSKGPDAIIKYNVTVFHY